MKVTAQQRSVSSEASAHPVDEAGFGRALASARGAKSSGSDATRTGPDGEPSTSTLTARGPAGGAAAPEEAASEAEASPAGGWTLGSGLLGTTALGESDAADSGVSLADAGLGAEDTSDAADAPELSEGELALSAEHTNDVEPAEPEGEAAQVPAGDDSAELVSADTTEAAEAAALEASDDTSPSTSMKSAPADADAPYRSDGAKETRWRSTPTRAAAAQGNTDAGEADGTPNMDGADFTSSEAAGADSLTSDPLTSDPLTSDLAPLRADAPAPLRAAPRTASAPVDAAPGAPLPEAEEVVDPALAMRLMREANGVQRAEVALEHPMFGALRMELALDDGAVDLRLLVPSLAGALRLERDEGEMRALLRDRGLRVASLEIERPDPGAAQDHVHEERPTPAAAFVHHRYHWKA